MSKEANEIKEKTIRELNESVDELRLQLEQLGDRINYLYDQPDELGNSLSSNAASVGANSIGVIKLFDLVTELGQKIDKIEARNNKQTNADFEKLEKVNEIYLGLLEREL